MPPFKSAFVASFVAIPIVFAVSIAAPRVNGEGPSTIQVHRDVVFANPPGKTNVVEQKQPQPLRLDLYLPANLQKSPLVVWIHGGGWRGGSKNKPHLLEVTERGYALASISYRLTDRELFPAQIHDCKSAIRWLRTNADRYGYDADTIVVAGSSAGGHLALLMGTSGDVTELEGDVGGNLEQSSRVQGVIDYFGPSDFVLRGKTQPGRAYTNKSGSYKLLGGMKANVENSREITSKNSEKDNLEGTRLDPAIERFASPTHYVSTDDPPLLIFHGTADQTVLIDQSHRIVEQYDAAGLSAELVVLKGAGHGGKKFFQGSNFDKVIHFLNQLGH